MEGIQDIVLQMTQAISDQIDEAIRASLILHEVDIDNHEEVAERCVMHLHYGMKRELYIDGSLVLTINENTLKLELNK